jgi:hypothetical protein
MKQRIEPIPAARRTEPTIGANDKRFVWNPLGDVQAVWRRFGWKPESERVVEAKPLRVVKKGASG